MNVVDYFNEKWNEFKSDGQKGEMKEFEYKKEKFNKFKQKVIGKETKYLAYRRTKEQKLRSIRIKGGKTTIFYNKRKLNELVNVIMMLEDKEKKIELLKEQVYFNYEFMLTKAELKEMDFVVKMHQRINELEDQELIDVSQVYVNHFPSIEQKPNRLCWIVPSRLEERSNYVRKLAERLLIFYFYIEALKMILR